MRMDKEEGVWCHSGGGVVKVGGGALGYAPGEKTLINCNTSDNCSHITTNA